MEALRARYESLRVLSVHDGAVALCRDGRPYHRSVRRLMTGKSSAGRPPLHGFLGLTRRMPSKPDAFYTVYCLIDPRDFRPFYVGRTKNPRWRYADHLSPASWAKSGSDKYLAKMQELRALGLGRHRSQGVGASPLF